MSAPKKTPASSTRPKFRSLKALLLAACPPDANGRRSITRLAAALKLSHYAVYKWINASRIPPMQVKPLLKLAAGAVTLADIQPWVFGEDLEDVS